MNVNALPVLAGRCLYCPAIFDAGEAVAIENYGAFGTRALAQHLCVQDGDRKEQHEGQEEPPGGEGISMKREPGRDQRRNDDQKAKISKAAMDLFKVRDLHFAGLLAPFVFLGRRGSGVRHRGIITYRVDSIAHYRGRNLRSGSGPINWRS